MDASPKANDGVNAGGRNYLVGFGIPGLWSPYQWIIGTSACLVAAFVLGPSKVHDGRK